MTTFKCRECDNHWSEGMTRDYKTSQLCRECLIHKLKVCHADAQRGREKGDSHSMLIALETIFLTAGDAIA